MSEKRFYRFDSMVFTRKFDLPHFRHTILSSSVRSAWREFKRILPDALFQRYGLKVTKVFFNYCHVFDLNGRFLSVLNKIN